MARKVMSRTPRPVPIDASDYFVKTATENVRSVLRRASPEVRSYGKRWYDQSHEWHGQLAQRHGASIEQTAGATARLSSGQSYPANLMMTNQLYRYGEEMEPHFEAMRQFQAESKAMPDDVRKAESGRVRSFLHGTPLHLQSIPNLVGAWDIRTGRRMASDVLPNDVKTREFNENILHPEKPKPITIDRHAHDATLGRTDLPYEENPGLSARGRYDLFADIWRQASSEEGYERAHEGQAVGWVQHRQEKIVENPSASRAAKAGASREANYNRRFNFLTGMENPLRHPGLA